MTRHARSPQGYPPATPRVGESGELVFAYGCQGSGSKIEYARCGIELLSVHATASGSLAPGGADGGHVGRVRTDIRGGFFFLPLILSLCNLQG